MTQNRLTQRLADYWEMLRKDQAIPEFARLNVSVISDIWPNCVLFSLQPAAEGKLPIMSISKIGENVQPIYSNEMLGLSFNAAQRHFQGAKIIHRVSEVLESRRPIFDEGQFVNEHSKIVKFRSCLMPFGTTEGMITHILVGLSWREY